MRRKYPISVSGKQERRKVFGAVVAGSLVGSVVGVVGLALFTLFDKH